MEAVVSSTLRHPNITQVGIRNKCATIAGLGSMMPAAASFQTELVFKPDWLNAPNHPFSRTLIPPNHTPPTQVFHCYMTPHTPQHIGPGSPAVDGAEAGGAFGGMMRDGAADGGQQAQGNGNLELRLVMEFCEEGSLRSALDCGLLADPSPPSPHRAAADDDSPALSGLDCVLSLAYDVAVAMLHLHSENMLHGDLKANNVLLARCSGAAAAVPAIGARAGGGGAAAGAAARHRFTAKVSCRLSFVAEPTGARPSRHPRSHPAPLYIHHKFTHHATK